MIHLFHPEAEQDLYEAALRYDSEVPGLGHRPESGSRVDENLRHFVLRKFPFSVVYAASADIVYIVAIAHGSREPEYWRPRVQDR